MRVWDGGGSFVTVVLLAEAAAAAARDAAVEAVKCEDTPVAPLEGGFVGGFVEACGARVLGFVVELAAAVVAVDELPSGAVESIVVCWSDAVASEVLWIVDGRVSFGTGGLTVERDAVVVVVAAPVELAVGFGLVAAAAVEVVDLAGTSRWIKKYMYGNFW